jgi:SprT protein
MRLTKKQRLLIWQRVHQLIWKWNFNSNYWEWKMPKINYFSKGSHGGWHQNGELFFNEILAKNNFEAYLNEIIPHEVAHYIQMIHWPDSKPHGVEFKRVMKVFGVPARAYHTLNCEGIKQRKERRIECKCSCEDRVWDLAIRRSAGVENKELLCPKCRDFIRF